MQVEHYEVNCYECEAIVHLPIDQPSGQCRCGVYIILKEFPAGNPLTNRGSMFRENRKAANE